ncbi:MAG: hypothetical protein M0R80_13365 [Proteobacteria bacterium]|jgi:histidinol dehydrogenase|nr:hypothetical protein [Pseudomonadota bacterium]
MTTDQAIKVINKFAPEYTGILIQETTRFIGGVKEHFFSVFVKSHKQHAYGLTLKQTIDRLLKNRDSKTPEDIISNLESRVKKLESKIGGTI